MPMMDSNAGTRRAEWLKEAKWGVFCHYLAPHATGGPDGKAFTSVDWNRRVNSFDTCRLAEQLETIGAKYFFLTIGQNSGFFCAPNPTYDAIVGNKPGKCSERDLISDLHEALSPKNIKLLVYLPSGAPAADPEAMEKLEWEWGFVGGWPKGWMCERTGKRLEAFQLKWEAVIRDWSIRWGRKVSGWWFDGCYFPDEMYRHSDEPNFSSFAEAARAGNPDSIVAFNGGLFTPVISMTEFEDYTAGEIDGSFYTGHYEKIGGEDKFTHYNGSVKGAQLHILTFLGQNWGGGRPRFPDELVIGYTKYINSIGGAVTWDAPISDTGKLPEEYMDQFMKLRGI